MQLFKYLLLGLLFTSTEFYAQRLVKTINSGWNFQLETIEETRVVNIPHTWNAMDAFKEGSYHRGKGIYTKELYIPKEWNKKSVFIKFEGANQSTQLLINGKIAGKHAGGYTSFVFELTEFLQYGSVNQIKVEVDNSHNADIPPLEADFNFYGGIYRDVELIVTGKSHFALQGEAAGSLLIKTPQVDSTIAKVIFEGKAILNNEDLELIVEINDALGNRISRFQKELKSENFSIDFKIQDPKLWSPDSPNLYNLQARLLDRNSGEIYDSYSSKFGCRWFRADPEKGFILNGRPVKLIGANRHQDYENMGNAVPNSIHRKDYQMIRDMGANFIRTAHYPQDPEVYKICDELGLLVWTEIPVINDVTPTYAYHENSLRMQREQILQLHNHPSIVFWGYMNEIFIRLVFTGDMTENDKNSKIATTVELAKKLEAETKKLDSTRLSVMALHENELYNTTGIADIPDVIGWNLYFGWYSQGLENLGKFLDVQHEKYPRRPILISEYGPGSDSRIQTNDPKPWDYSEAYQLKSHVSYLNQIMERDYMLGMAAWNFADFGSSGRQDSRPFINQKGLVNFDREPKDIYYYYKARLSDEDFVYIAGKNFETRFLKQNEKVKLKVFSNSGRVKLLIDGNIEIIETVKNNIAEFEFDLNEGSHIVKAISGRSSDESTLEIFKRDQLLSNISNKPLTINVGSHSDFVDVNTGEIWIADQSAEHNNFGYIGGENFQHTPDKFQGTDADISGTTGDPLYQTMREGIQNYKFEVPGGKYRVSLLMTEPNRSAAVENIYNLNSGKKKISEEIRNFDILINQQLMEENLNLARDYGILHAVELNYEVATNKGINIRFRSKNGKPVLSGIRLEKL